MSDYPKVDKVSISSRAKIHIPPPLIIHQDTSDDVAQVSELCPGGVVIHTWGSDRFYRDTVGAKDAFDSLYR